MTNENNNINELVADDDPTVELEIPSFAADGGNTAEAEAKTYDAHHVADADPSLDLTVSELQSDLRSRKKTNSKLQYDIQQLQSKWLGLETEISARELQTEQLNNELSSSQKALERKENLLKKRNQKIKSLKAEIRQRNEEFRQLEKQLDDVQLSATKPPSITPDEEDKSRQGDLRPQLQRTEEYADTLRQQSQDLIKSNSRAERKIKDLSRRMDDATLRHSQLSRELALSVVTVNELQSVLDDIQNRHDEEIRLLRFELGTAQNTVVESEEMNSQLASDLVDACSFKDELEQMLGEVEEQSSGRIDELQKEVSKLNRAADRSEQKLTTKSEAITVLLAELAKRSEQLESIGEIEDVIQDIDEQMSERQQTPVDRVSRVLIGTVDEQVLRFPLFKDRLTIGRTRDNDIQLKAGYVSRRHAVIQTDGGSTRIIDWGSKNGIHVNSAKISEHRLCHGDTVTIGNARFRYEERKKRDS